MHSSHNTSIRKLAIWIMAVLYITLPTYLAFEISSIFPSFTGSRIVLLLSLFALIIMSGKLRISHGKWMRVIYVYMAFVILANLVHLSDSFTYSIKAIFELFFEVLLLVFVIYSLIETKKQLEWFVRLMVITSGIITLFAIVEFLTGYNVFYLLTTTSRTVYQASYVRSGMTRAEASFGHSVYYGVYCSCMLPFTLYLYENSKKRSYLLIALLNIIGVLISGSRGQMVALAGTIILMLLRKRANLRRKYFTMIIVALIVGCMVIVFIPSVFNYILDNVKSILNIVGFSFELSSDYGINAIGIDSRTIQFTGLKWLAINGMLLWGFGSLASSRGLIAFDYSPYGWQVVTSVDVGYLAWFFEYGIIGAIGYIILFVSFTFWATKRSNEKDVTNFYNPLKWFFVCYLLNMLSSTGFDKMLWVVIALMICYGRISKNEILPAG